MPSQQKSRNKAAYYYSELIKSRNKERRIRKAEKKRTDNQEKKEIRTCGNCLNTFKCRKTSKKKLCSKCLKPKPKKFKIHNPKT